MTRHFLEVRHQEHLRKLGVKDIGDHVDMHDAEYEEHYALWRATLPKASPQVIHLKALGHAGWVRHSAAAPEVKKEKRSHELRWIIALLAAIFLLLAFQPKAHAQFSKISTIQTKQASSGIGFHASPFVINCGANMSCTDDGTTFNLTAGAGATVAWDGILAAAGNFALAHAARTTTFTWGAATGAGVDMFTFADTLNNTGTGYILRVNLASGSAAKPFSAAVNGNGVSVSNTGVLAKLGTGSVNADQCNGAACGTVTSVATTAPITGGAITSTGTIACATCATTTNGGALSGTAPVTVSAAGAIGCATCLTGNQTITLSGDVTGSGSTAITTANVNLPDGVTQAGSLVVTDIAAPTSPAASHLKVFGDSTDLRFHDKNAGGVIGTTVVADTGAANNFMTAISAAGAISKAQPVCGNLSNAAASCSTDATNAANIGSGTLPAGRMPALTGAITTSAGAVATSPGKDDLLDSQNFCQAAGASATTYTCSLSPAITAYVTGTHYRFKADVANSGAATINFNAVGAIAIKKAAGGITTALVANDLQAGQWVDLVYDGTNMQMQSLLGNAPAAGSGCSFTTSNQGSLWGPTIGHPYSTAAAQAVAAANRVMVVAMSLPCTYKISKFLYNISTTNAASHCDIGYYDASGNLLVHTGSIDSSANAKNQAATSATSIGSAYVYYAWSCDSTVVQFTSILDTNQSTIFNGDAVVRYGRCANAATAGVLPATCGALTADATANPVLTVGVP